MASQTSFSSSPPRPKKEYKSVVPVLRGRAKPAPRSLLLWGGGLLPIRATFEKPPFRGPAINLHAKESPVAKTWGKQSGDCMELALYRDICSCNTTSRSKGTLARRLLSPVPQTERDG